MNFIQILSGSFQIHSVLSDIFSTFRSIQHFQIYSVFLQSVLLQSVLYNQRFQSIQYLQGTKKT